MVCFGNKEQPKLPYVIMGEDKVDPLRDERVTKVVREQGMKHCFVTPWSFRREWLRALNGIATNSSAQFIVGDKYEVKIFDPTGQFIQYFSLRIRRVIRDFKIWYG